MNTSILSSEKTKDYENSSPFLEAYEVENQLNDKDVNPYFDNDSSETPFLYAYESAVSVDGVTPEAEDFSQLLHELYDREFDHGIYDLASSFRAELEDIRSSEFDNHQSLDSSINVLEAKLEPIIGEGEALIDDYIKLLDEVDLLAISDKEFDDLVDAVDDAEFDSSEDTPLYEDFKRRKKKRRRGWLKKKIKKAVKYAGKTVKGLVKNPGKTIKKLAKDAGKFVKGKLKKFLRGLKKILKKLLRHVLNVAAGLLPSDLRPVAKKLARKILKKEVEENYSNDYAFNNGIGYIQQELDLSIASLLSADEDELQEEIVNEFLEERNFVSPQVMESYDHARDEFIENITNLSDEEVENPESFEPIVQHFVSAAIKALKIGYKLLGGRPKLINAITKILSKLIAKYVGKKHSKALAKALTDIGLRIFNLENSDEDELIVSGEIIAATIEDAVTRLATLPDHILDNDQLIANFILESFENAAASYFPPIFPEDVYEDRPDLRESQHPSVWMNMGRRSVKYKKHKKFFGRRKKYKKCTRVIPRKITPEMMDRVTSWRGRSLRSLLKKCGKIGRKGKVRKIRAHLYELERGGWLSDIIRNEADELNLTEGGELVLEQFHPLTEKASERLFNELRLGRNVSSEFLVDPINTVSGQRFYFLEFVGNGQDEHYTGYQSGQPCCTQHVTLDFPQNQIRLATFLDEDQAENISSMLRRGAGISVIVRQIRQTYKNGLEKAFAAGVDHQLNIIHGRLFPDRHSGKILKLLPMGWIDQIKELLVTWTDRQLIDSLADLKTQIIAATQNPAVGITLSITFIAPSFLTPLNKLLAGQPVSVTSQLSDKSGEAMLRIVPGDWHG